MSVELNICPADDRLTTVNANWLWEWKGLLIILFMKDIYIISWHYKALMRNIEAFML